MEPMSRRDSAAVLEADRVFGRRGIGRRPSLERAAGLRSENGIVVDEYDALPGVNDVSLPRRRQLPEPGARRVASVSDTRSPAEHTREGRRLEQGSLHRCTATFVSLRESFDRGD